jgi:integrase
MSGYTAKLIRVEDNGERAVLIVDEIGLPVDLPSRFLINKIQSRSYKTVLNLGRNICQLYRWADSNNMDLYDRIRSGYIFGITEIDSLVRYLSMNRRQVKNEDNVRHFSGYVSGSMLSQKIDAAKVYFKFIGDLAVEGRRITDPLYSAIGPAIQDLNDSLEARKIEPLVRKRVGLTLKEQQTLLTMTQPGHEQNPFRLETQVRNHLIFKVLLLTGVRLGELLALRIENCHLTGDETYLAIGQNIDKKEDPRLHPPEAKTIGRRIYITKELAAEIDNYILGDRKFRGKAARRAAPYLFLNTNKNPAAMTDGALYSAISLLKEKFPETLGELHPHRLRHTFNDNFVLTYADSMTDEELLKMQCWLNGWGDSSKQGKNYTEYSTELLGMRCLEALQKNVMSGVLKPEDWKNPSIETDFDSEIPF